MDLTMKRMQPMRGKTIDDPRTLRYPLLGSPKLDGIRALVRMNEDVVSRKLKRIPNRRIQEVFGLGPLRGYDGELIAGDPTEPGCWNRTDSVVMSATHEDSDTVRFYVFDRWTPVTKNWPYTRRRPNNSMRHPRVVLVPQVLVSSPEELLRFHRRIVAKGYEGTMYRDPEGLYKYGRSTLAEQYLLKYKDTQDDEARIVALKQEKENRNPQTRSKLGYAKRSSHKANKVPKNQIGSLRLRMLTGPFKGKECSCGMGIDDELGRHMHRYPHRYLGRVVKVRYRVEAGADVPWNTRLLGLRRD